MLYMKNRLLVVVLVASILQRLEASECADKWTAGRCSNQARKGNCQEPEYCPNPKKDGVKCQRARSQCQRTCGLCGSDGSTGSCEAEIATIAEHEATIAANEATIAEKEEAIAEHEATIADKDAQLAECGSPRPPPPPPSPPQTTTDFEGGSLPAGWTTGGGSSYEWTQHSGSTPSDDTGPSSGHGGSGSYMYVEVTPRQTGDVFVLLYDGSHCASLGLSVSDVDFFFHMWGATMGTLSLVDAEGRERWIRSGDQGDAWQNASVGVHSASFEFRYVRGSGYHGDAAVDDIVVGCGSAPPSPPPS